MCKSFMDIEDGDLCFSTSDNMAMDSEGHMMMNNTFVPIQDPTVHILIFPLHNGRIEKEQNSTQSEKQTKINRNCGL